MKLTVIIFFACCLHVSARTNAQLITLDVKKAPIQQIFREIFRQTGVSVIYDENQVQSLAPVTIKVKSVPIKEVLDLCLKGNSLEYVIEENSISIKSGTNTGLKSRLYDDNPNRQSAAANPPITGVVRGPDGQPVADANVVIKGTRRGTTTDANGNFSLNVDANAILVISHIGFEPTEINVGDRSVIAINLKASSAISEQIVVVGYGTQKKLNLTGAVDVISSDVLKNRAPANVGSLLQGVSPNLNISITQNGGEPGAGNFFNIRGIGTLSGDGAPLILVDGFEMNINNLDPENIESISVLKDAASASVYGSRAPFGVVLITTKKGSKKKGMSITYTNNISSASPISLPKWQSSLRYVTAYNQSLQNSGLPEKFLPPQIERIKAYIAGTYKPEYDTVTPPNSIWAGRHEGNANYEWFDEYFRDYTINQKHNINMSGGDDRTQYFISAGLYDQGSSYNWTDEYYRRYNVLANINSQVASWLRLNLNTKYSNTEKAHPNLGTWDSDRNFIISEMIKFFPTTTFYNVSGTVNNPYANMLMQTGPATFDENDLFISLGGEIEPITGWKTNFNYNYNYTGSKNTWLGKKMKVEIPDGQIIDFWNDPDYFTQSWNSNNYSAFNGVTSYEKNINRHFLKAMAGYERENKYFSSIYGDRSDLISDLVPSFSTATGVFNLGDAASHWATEAFFGRLNYNYQEKFLLEVNGRYNGSSRFAKDSRWGFFPSVSAGYNISRESFWEPLKDYINNFKIRASYGSLGNQNVPNYLYLSIIPISTGLPWIIDGQRPNYANVPPIISPSLTWESINTLNFGLDANFLNNRLSLAFDWFERNTKNMFGPSTILPSALGTTPPQLNNASLNTKGWEISIDWKDRIAAGMHYSVKINLADARSRISKYLNITGQVDQQYVGKEIGTIWGYTTAGLIQSETEAIADQSFFYNKWGPGDIKYADLNGDGKINDGNRTLDNHGDLSVIGNTSPRYSIGFSGMIGWKNFDFTMFWQGILKRDLMPRDNIWWGVATQGDNGGAFYQRHDDYWRPADEKNIFGPNTDAFYAKPYVTAETYKNQAIQTRYLLDAGYFRLKNAQLGYTIPQRLTSKIKVQSLRIYFSGENLVTFTSLPPYIDPETSFAGTSSLGAIYPVSRSISAGLGLTF